MLVSSDDGGVDDEILEVRIIGQSLENATPYALGAPPAKPAKHRIPFTKGLRQVPPRRSRSHDPQHAFHEHPIVTARRTALVLPSDDQRSDPLPLYVVQYQSIQNAQDCLPKSNLESDLLAFGNPKSPHDLEHDPQKWKPLLRKDHAQAIELARVLFDQVIPPGRNAR
jgi:hypothetical protein